MKERFRKFVVSLKRRPQNIALLALVLSFVYYSFNLTKISDTTAKIQGKHMGLCGFITMLLSILVFVCFLNSFPKRKKPNYIMIGLMYVMFVIIITCDIVYRSRIVAAMGRDGFDVVMRDNAYISKAMTVVTVHVVLVVIVAVLVALVPVFGKLLKKVKTSIDVEDNGNLEAIDVEED